MIDTAIIIQVYAWVAWALVTALLGLAYWATGILGRTVFRRLRHIYRLDTIYWYLQKWEKEGVLKPPKREDES